MKTAAFAAAAAALLAFAPAEALAGPSIWVQCDGNARPMSDAETAARATAVILGSGFLVGLLALPEASTGAPVASGKEGVEACTAALADPALTPFWQRRVSILRARAIHYVEMDELDGALADLTAARDAGAGKAAPAIFERSIGVSSKLFEAALRARKGEAEAARALAIEAADARPYAAVVQSLALSFIAEEAKLSPDTGRIIHRAMALDPHASTLLAGRLDASDDAAAAADAWEAAVTAHARMRFGQKIYDALDDAVMNPTADDPMVLMSAALAAARAGRVERAEALLARYDAAYPATADVADGSDEDATDAKAKAAKRTNEELRAAAKDRLRAQLLKNLKEGAEKERPLITALLKEKSGDAAGALEIVQANFDKLPAEMATVELLRRLSANPKTAAQTPTFLANTMLARVRPDLKTASKDLDLKSLVAALPNFERIDDKERYRKGSVTGYSAAPSKTDPTVTSIAYNGAPSYYAHQEMVTLRAAEMAKAAGKDGFIVKKASHGDIEVSFVGADAKPEDLGDRAGFVVSADDVLSTLKPIYIDLPLQVDAEKAQARARRP